ncbi:MAG: peptidyl-prolyl cis-trans isomerase [Spirochaetales bacterium]|nr:peptidyl-prolyl cis-trans isomerase [Spirochaetales bacterium]
MNRIIPAVAAVLLLAGFAGAQSTLIDAPVATVKLLRSEVLGQRQFALDVQVMEKALGRKLSAEEKRQYLETKVNDLLFFQMCERDKLFATEAEIDAYIKMMREQTAGGLSDAQFEAALKAQGIDFAELRKSAKQQILFQKYVDTFRKSDVEKLKAPTADEVIEAYELNKSSYLRPDTVRVSVIYVDTRGMDAAGRAKAKTMMLDLAARIRENPVRFDEYLVKASDPSSGFRGTSSLYVPRSPQAVQSWGQEFMDSAFGLKAGQIGELVENEAGYQIIRVNEILPLKILSLTDPFQPGQSATVQDVIRYQLLQSARQKLLSDIMESLIAELRKAATVKIYEENLK